MKQKKWICLCYSWDLSEYKNYWSEAHFWGRGQCVSIEFLMRKCFEQNSLWNDDSRDRSLLMWSKINTINFQPRKYSHFQVCASFVFIVVFSVHIFHFFQRATVMLWALLLEALGIVTRSVLGNCLRVNCVINFDQTLGTTLTLEQKPIFVVVAIIKKNMGTLLRKWYLCGKCEDC